MTAGQIGKIERIPLREVWQHEAKDFTFWMAENIDALNEALGFELSIVEQEKSVGLFSLDLLATDSSGDLIAIENQYGSSDHDHLGKVLTYLTNLDAKAAIWIVENARPEHVTAISWLNEASSASFFLVKLEAIKINDSLPAPLFTLIVGPSEELKAMGSAKKDVSKTESVYFKFWQGLLAYAAAKTKLFANISPQKRAWIRASGGISNVTYQYLILKAKAFTVLYFMSGDAELNLKYFKFLEQHKGEIEEKFGEPLEWDAMAGRTACKIRKLVSNSGFGDPEENWDKIYESLVEAMIRLEKTFSPFIKKLKR